MIKNMSLLFCLSIWSISSIAATVLLDTTTINFSASGTPNSISGNWGANALVISDGSTIDYFTVEMTDYTPTSRQPLGIGFNMLPTNVPATMGICWNTEACATNTFIGDIGIVDSNSPTLALSYAWNFLNRLVEGHQYQTNSGQVSVGYSSGGDYASITGLVIVNVYGETVVPTPPALWLFSSGLIGLIGLARRKVRV